MLLTESSCPSSDSALLAWPPKVEVLGIQVAVTTYDEAVACILESALRKEPAIVSCQAVHAIVSASRSPQLRTRVNCFALVAPDGQPVRWAMNLLHGTGVRERVYGPELMLRLCREAAGRQVPIYLYGSTPTTVERLRCSLTARFPELLIAGAESPPFRQLSVEEDRLMVERINRSGAGLLFLGLGCPKQDHFAFEHRDRIRAVQICVGAAFDFHAGTKRSAPVWMQKRGLEWLFRLYEEPRRLWRRYLITNSIFLARVLQEFCRRRFRTRRKR